MRTPSENGSTLQGPHAVGHWDTKKKKTGRLQESNRRGAILCGVWGVRVGCACGLLCDDWGSAAYLVALAVPSDLGHALSEYIVCISTGIQGPGAQASRQARKPKAPHQIQMRDGPSRRALVAMPVAIVVSMSMTMVPRVLQALT